MRRARTVHESENRSANRRDRSGNIILLFPKGLNGVSGKCLLQPPAYKIRRELTC